ncbi:MAG: TonB-dependent receptor [Gammaproteobacteria bacterium]|nr:TonB-dependent receptor [Gammaproteobacteria bacterium]
MAASASEGGIERIKRSANGGAAPVDIITRAQIERTGITKLPLLIRTLIPYFDFSAATVSEGAGSGYPSTLRGLFADQVLVLVNGKRRHNSAVTHVGASAGRGAAGTDLSAIPLSTIERIEILRDGATAQHGSGAVAGVINIVLKQDTGTTELQAYYGETYDGDGDQRRHSLNTGWTLGDDGFFNLSLERCGHNPTDRAGRDTRCQYFEPCVFDKPQGIDHIRQYLLYRHDESAFDGRGPRLGNPKADNLYVAFNSELPLNNTTLYAFGVWSRRDVWADGLYRRPLDLRNRRSIYQHGFHPEINTDMDDLSLTLGERMQFGEWDVDASVTHGRNISEFHVDDSLNASLGNGSPTSADAGELVFGQTTFNFDAERPLGIGLAEPASLTAGYEYRREYYKIRAGEPDSWRDGGFRDTFLRPAATGIQGFPGFRPGNKADEDRHNHAFYMGMTTRLSERLETGATVRYANYSDFGNAVSGELKMHYQLSERFALRGTLSSGFRAPGLAQHYFDNVSTQFNVENGVTVARETLTARNEAAFARAIGVEELKEETSFNLSLGFVARPFDNLSLSVDAYLIEVDDRIVLSSRLGGDQIRPELQAAALAILNRDYGFNLADISGLRFQFFTNAIDTRTRGVDVVAEWSHWLDHGASLKLTGAANVNSSDVEGGIDLPAGLTAGTDLFSANEVGYIESGHPRQSYKFQAHYLLGVHDLTLRLNRYGSVTSNYDAVRQTYGARWLADIEYTHHFGADVDWTVGVNNLLDTRPERNLPENSFNGIFPYNRRASPFDYNGGFYFTSLKVSF